MSSHFTFFGRESDLDFNAYFIVKYRGRTMAKVLGVQGAGRG
jgi:hypothetical protein